jgi:iron(III) transport system substrate-binding protein
MSQRARVIWYAKDRVENPPQTYEALADPQYKGQICIRSSSNVYNQSKMSSIIAVHGEEAATEWAAGVLANLARAPEGGDTDQLKGIVSGECDIAVANTYYFLRALNSEVDGLTGSTDQIGWVWPNQNDRGTHTNVAAMALTAHAPNRDDAIAFMEFMTTEYAQSHFADQNNEYPAVPGVPLGEGVASMGFFIPDNTTGTVTSLPRRITVTLTESPMARLSTTVNRSLVSAMALPSTLMMTSPRLTRPRLSRVVG